MGALSVPSILSEHNISNSLSVKVTSCADIFSSRCVTVEVPGIGIITWLRFNKHASAICADVAFLLLAIALKIVSATKRGL